MIKRILVLWGPSFEELNDGKEHSSIKEAHAHVAELKKSRDTNHQAYRMVKIISNGDFTPAKEYIYDESENPKSRFEKRLSARGLNKK